VLAPVTFFGCVVAAVWAGAQLPSATVVVLLGLVGLVMIPPRPSQLERAMLLGAAGLQIAACFAGLGAGLPDVATWASRALGF